MIEKIFLQNAYVTQKKSVAAIAKGLGCSENKVTYWLQKHNIRKRTISDALYVKNNPQGDPFDFLRPTRDQDWFLYGLGLGIFWGEGNKVNKSSVRLGNTDPALIRVFLTFLHKIYNIDSSRLRFGLQIFTDTSREEALAFWCHELGVSADQFQKVILTKSLKRGTYKHKNRHGVLTVYFSNTKLRDTIMSAIEALHTTSYANVAQSVERIHGKSQ